MRHILLYDTTLRDGSQGEGISFSLQDKLNISERLIELGIDYLEGGYPLSNPKDAAFFDRARRLNWGSTRLTAFGMTRRRGVKAEQDIGLQALLAAQTPAVTVVGKSWDLHVTDVLGVALEENLEMIAQSVAYLAQHREVLYDAEHFFDGFRANPQYALQTVTAAASAGATWIVLCDTNGGSLPEQIAATVAQVRKQLPELKLGIHCHNDSDLATANSLAAVHAGCDQVQGTINGIGERCGNADLIPVAANLALKHQGYRLLTPESLPHLTPLSRYVYETANLQLRGGQPFVGSSAFAHKGGMHVHAVNKVSHSYEHIDPRQVGNERKILVSELSGRSNIVALTQKHTAISQERELMDKILAEVVDRESQGYQYESAEASFDLMVLRAAGLFQPHFQAIKYRIVAGDRDVAQHRAFAEAILKLKIDDHASLEAAEGHGPVNALDAALRKSLLPIYPALATMFLVDYKVRVVNCEAGTAARIRVNIESSDHQHRWGTIGVSENLIEASWLALNDAFEYKLHLDLGRIPQPHPALAEA